MGQSSSRRPLDYHPTHQRNAAKHGIKRLLFRAEPWKDFWARSPAAATNCLYDLEKVSSLTFSLGFLIFSGGPFCTSPEDGTSALGPSLALW